MGLFRKSVPGDPLAVTMAGVKLGQRVLVVGVRDPKLAAQLAIRAGLTGRTCVVDDNEAELARAAAEIEKEGALVEPTRAPYGMWPFDPESFDVVVIPELLPALDADVREHCLREVFRVLRGGGRAIVVEAARRGGLGALLTKASAVGAYEGPIAALQAVGFTAVRDLASTSGVSYTEGIKRVDRD